RVGKLQALDVYEMVGAIAVRHAVRNGPRVQPGLNDAVVGTVALENRRIEIVGPADGICRSWQNLAYRYELPRIVRAVEHQRYQRGEAVEGRNLVAGAVAVGAHA